ncbi:N-methyl-L-tryptophan oxidase [Mycobacterium sp. 21AC1]|uniref:N-methyl-L-tryptophan oxidase n=1 Tax=[Mycobacterium] appelbergii TaxID=2939269 RepID=UPI002939183A|nr:N-methyl-L-tryptophan oxidase [Mycobacterium sp. 21AC1]MDV3129523.1 N-methyl-L-tryptophan oxidase [Mycobacterium sp. 21AC1]
MDAEVAVIGIGTIGSMTLWQLARAGVDVIGFEQFSIGHDKSAAGGESRIFRTAYVEGPQYIPFLQRSLELWRELEGEAAVELLRLTSGLTIGSPHSSAITQVIKGCDQYGLPHEFLDHTELQARYPQHLLHSDEVGVVDPHAGFIRPERAVTAAARAARQHGAHIVTDTRIDAITPHQGKVRIHAGERVWTVAQVVLTVGPWMTAMMPTLSGHVVPHRVQLAWHAVSDPEQYLPDNSPVFMRQSPNGLLFGFPTLDGSTVKVGIHQSYPDFGPSDVVVDPDRLDGTVNRDQITAVGRGLATFLAGLTPQPSRVETYMDGYTVDDAPVVGSVPGQDNIWILGGFSGHGFKMAPAFGEAAAELARVGTSTLLTTAFRPGRFVRQGRA